jgi:GNAT superfamily N-acetyltransferase
MHTTTFRTVSAGELDSVVPALVERFTETVNAGVPLGFMQPLSRAQGRAYWLSLRDELQAGSRLLVAACSDEGVVGAGQLALSTWSNSPHRAELQKVFVAVSCRGRGIGRLLMSALHDVARERGRSLLCLNTRKGGRAEAFYRRLGYREAGVIPGWTLGPAGERYTHVTLYRELAA